MNKPGTVGRLEDQIRDGEILEVLAVTRVDGKTFLVYMNPETNEVFCPEEYDTKIIKKAYIEAKRGAKK